MGKGDAITKLMSDGAKILEGVLRRDGWENVLTGLGTRERDKAISSEFKRVPREVDQVYEDLYHGNFLARKIVQDIVEESMGTSLTLRRKTADGEEPATDEEIDQLTAEMEKFDVREKFVRAVVWGRLYGRGALYPIMTGGDQTQPIDFEREGMRMVDLVVLERRDYSAFLLDDFTLDPEMWILTTDDIEQGTQVHDSRLIHFGGIRTARRERIRMDWSDHSALQPVIDILRDFGSNWRAVVNRMSDASQGIYRLKGLFDMVTGSEAGLANLKKRMTIVEMCRSVARALILDADEESFEYQEVGFQGVPEVMTTSMQMVASAADMPMTRLFGIPPGGLGSEDVSGQRNWAKRVDVFQELQLRRPLELLVNIVADQAGLGRGWVVEFPSPWAFTPKEEAELRSSVASTDVQYINAGVYVAEEVALVRSREDGFMDEIEVDTELRQKLLDMTLENKTEMKEQGPPSFLPSGDDDEDDEDDDDDEDDLDPDDDSPDDDEDRQDRMGSRKRKRKRKRGKRRYDQRPGHHHDTPEGATGPAFTDPRLPGMHSHILLATGETVGFSFDGEGHQHGLRDKNGVFILSDVAIEPPADAGQGGEGQGNG